MKYAHTNFEQDYWNKGYEYVVGIDEVGRGCWAGPAVVGAVVFPKNSKLDFKLADSKKLSEKKRNELVPLIKAAALSYAVHEVPVNEINTHGVGKAIQNGFNEVLKIVYAKIDFVLIDGFKIQGYPTDKQQAIIKGDEQSVSIAAASILAKHHRDAVMRQVDSEDPRYCFNTNVGYGTKNHREAIAKYGLSNHHRTSYKLEKWLHMNEW